MDGYEVAIHVKKTAIPAIIIIIYGGIKMDWLTLDGGMFTWKFKMAAILKKIVYVINDP